MFTEIKRWEETGENGDETVRGRGQQDPECPEMFTLYCDQRKGGGGWMEL